MDDEGDTMNALGVLKDEASWTLSIIFVVTTASSIIISQNQSYKLAIIPFLAVLCNFFRVVSVH